MTTEQYQGVKFTYRSRKKTYQYDTRLNRLNYWAYLFAELGLAPAHTGGTYGNSSYRTGETSFIITRSGMTPSATLDVNAYSHIVGYAEESGTFLTEGVATPSSESFLHQYLYQSLPRVNAILHGHCFLLNMRAEQLGIPVTRNFFDYGTRELARSGLELALEGYSFFLLKDHGFVALGTDIDSAGKLTLHYYGQLVALLRSA
ncbi:class II aldolase/adducin family protein [Desulforhopalus singaporensis]|uniref:Ribulose-5-phosphate 4-epimerase/Fuculose-1-phosphate aldolase n=1 Tax=Desulforhopalus singaporensis TaxID=91360 RepID=A0A1H0UBT7_9BACT|nr:class II aldolase/adducin family protein [Desulforhopalus singaporensis]SDP63591.1 Ribulose-5-phosphate 4-epimerase/Fuculose-1-phosphate aldolase [Desulforhopalus singaporensis]